MQVRREEKGRGVKKTRGHKRRTEARGEDGQEKKEDERGKTYI